MIKKTLKAVDTLLFASVIVIGLAGTYIFVQEIALHKRYKIPKSSPNLVRKEKGCYITEIRFHESYYCSEESWLKLIKNSERRFPVFEEGKYYVYSWDRYVEIPKEDYFILYNIFYKMFFFGFPGFICMGFGYLLERVFLKDGGYFWRPERWRVNNDGVMEFKPTAKELSEKRILLVLFILLFTVVVLPLIYRAIHPPVFR